MGLEQPKTAVAVILLDLDATLRAKHRNKNQRRVEIYMGNKAIWRRINATTRVANNFNQDSAVEIIAIKKLIKEVDLDVMLILEQGHGEVQQAFHLKPGPKLIQMCDAKAKDIRMNAEIKVMNNNMSYYGEKLIIKDGQIASLPVK